MGYILPAPYLKKYYMKKLLFILIPFSILSCVTRPQIKQYNLSGDTNMYFFPASIWIGDDINAAVDFNFKNDADIETICNISIRQKEKLPSGISSILFNADSIDYSLNNLKILSVDNRSDTVRITSVLSHDNFLKIMRSKDVFLQIIIDGIKHECTPNKDFLILQNEFQNNYLTIENILK
jgi:hypothetical protein